MTHITSRDASFAIFRASRSIIPDSFASEERACVAWWSVRAWVRWGSNSWADGLTGEWRAGGRARGRMSSCRGPWRCRSDGLVDSFLPQRNTMEGRTKNRWTKGLSDLWSTPPSRAMRLGLLVYKTTHPLIQNFTLFFSCCFPTLSIKY